MLIEITVNTIFQLILFSAVPFIWWFMSVRKKENFFSWLGFSKPKFDRPVQTFILMSAVFVALLVVALFMTAFFEDRSVLAAARFERAGLEGAIAIVVYAVFQTGLSEEILFRGFLNKRLSTKFGFAAGNTVQAVLFGLVHGILLFNAAEMWLVALIVPFTAGIGWLLGYLNEKLAGGSILPSWAIHSLANVIPAFLFLFGIF